MKDLIWILICFCVILCLFMIVVYYTGAFWVKIFKFLYRFIEKYWYYIWIDLGVGVLIYEFMNFII